MRQQLESLQTGYRWCPLSLFDVFEEHSSFALRKGGIRVHEESQFTEPNLLATWCEGGEDDSIYVAGAERKKET